MQILPVKINFGDIRKYRRKNEKRNQAIRNENGLTKIQQDLSDLKLQIEKLKGQGLSNIAIARTLNCSEDKIRNL
ncbi:MAG: hypothetical protein E6X43_03230 [Peptostreptococcaceae bacterium]|nr:hypothetical protein [Peptostreptococcaceae bacterium]